MNALTETNVYVPSTIFSTNVQMRHISKLGRELSYREELTLLTYKFEGKLVL